MTSMKFAKTDLIYLENTAHEGTRVVQGCKLYPRIAVVLIFLTHELLYINDVPMETQELPR